MMKQVENHDRRLKAEMYKVGKLDQELGDQMVLEYDGLLRALHDIIGEWGKTLERWA